MQFSKDLLLCLLVVPQLASAVVVAKNAAGARKYARSGASNAVASNWDPMGFGLGASGDLPTQSFLSSESSMISVPGEGAIQDEMLALKQPTSTRPPPQVPQKSSSLLTFSSKLQSKGLMEGASFESGFFDTPAVVVAKTTAAKATVPKVLAEYDVDTDEVNDDYRTTKVEEAKTKEEVEREKRGDVEHVKPSEAKHPTLLRRKLKLTAAVQQQARVAVKEEQAPGGDKMMGQCMSFAGWVKGQGSTGPDLVRIWKGTCMPSVMAGDAPPAFSNMCNAVGTAVSKYAVGPWEPATVCNAVLAVFKESGVGATPLR